MSEIPRSKAAFGDEWKGKVVFYREISRPGTRECSFGKQELSVFSDIMGAEGNEPILEVSVYDKPLLRFQVTKILFRHCFVVLKTKSWFWSIEKTAEGIVLQTDKSHTPLTKKIDKKDRVNGQSFSGY